MLTLLVTAGDAADAAEVLALADTVEAALRPAHRVAAPFRAERDLRLVVRASEPAASVLDAALNARQIQASTEASTTTPATTPPTATVPASARSWLRVIPADADPLAALAEPSGAVRPDAAPGWVAHLEPTDRLEPSALGAVLHYLLARPQVEVLYTDECWRVAGERERRFAKPDFCPHYLEGYDYTGALLCVRTDLYAAVGGRGHGFGGGAGASWDLALRVSERAAVIEHLPLVAVAHTREATLDSGTAIEIAVAAAERRGERVVVEAAELPGAVRLWRELPSPAPRVTLVVPTGTGRRTVDGIERVLLVDLVASLLERTTYPNWNLVVVPSEGADAAVLEQVREMAGDRVSFAPVAGPFSYSYSTNEGVRLADGEYVVLLNDDIEVVEPRWLERMVSVAQDPRVGIVGAKLLFGNDTIQHVGVVFDDDWLPIHLHRAEADDTGYYGSKVLDIDYTAVTAACLLLRKELFEQVGGCPEDLPLNFNDLDLCLKVRALGLGVVCTPFARLHHFESTTREVVVTEHEWDYLFHHTIGPVRADPHVHWRRSI